MKKLIAILLSSLTITAIAQGYVTSSDGNIVRSGTGLCWQTGTFSPSEVKPECQPVKVVNQSLNADVLFEFDKSTLTAAGQMALDKIAQQILPNSPINVVGHTDRIGTLQYNTKLSRDRAMVVAQYLGKRVPGMYNIQGVAFNRPSGKTDSCVGTKVTPQLIDCLAPDRRVVLTYMTK